MFLLCGRGAAGAADGSRSGGYPKSTRSLLCLLPVNGVIELLHLLISEDTVSEVGLELLHGQLPIV